MTALVLLDGADRVDQTSERRHRRRARDGDDQRDCRESRSYGLHDTKRRSRDRATHGCAKAAGFLRKQTRDLKRRWMFVTRAGFPAIVSRLR
jgi:hypothetical protein